MSDVTQAAGRSSTAAHSRLPWRVGDREPYVEIWGQQHMNAFPILASMESNPREANAAFIVRACNSHYELIEVLRLLTEQYKQVCKDNNVMGWPALLLVANSAIAKAEGR